MFLPRFRRWSLPICSVVERVRCRDLSCLEYGVEEVYPLATKTYTQLLGYLVERYGYEVEYVLVVSYPEIRRAIEECYMRTGRSLCGMAKIVILVRELPRETSLWVPREKLMLLHELFKEIPQCRVDTLGYSLNAERVHIRISCNKHINYRSLLQRVMMYGKALV